MKYGHIYCLIILADLFWGISVLAQPNPPDIQLAINAQPGEISDTYISADGRAIIMVLEPDVDFDRWEEIGRQISAERPFVESSDLRAVRGGAGLILRLNQPMSLIREQLAIIDQSTVRWEGSLSIITTEQREADRLAAIARGDAGSLVAIDAQPRGGVVEFVLLGQRDLAASIDFLESPHRMVVNFPGNQVARIGDVLPIEWPDLIGNPLVERLSDGGWQLVFETDVPLDLVGATTELDAELALSRTRVLLGEDRAPTAEPSAVAPTVNLRVRNGLDLTVSGDQSLIVQSVLLAEPPQLVVDLLGLAPQQAESVVARLRQMVDPAYLDSVDLTRTRLGSARLLLNLSPDYAQGLALDMVPYRHRLADGEMRVALPEAGRLGIDPALADAPIVLEAGGLVLRLPRDFALGDSVGMGMGSTQLPDIFYQDDTGLQPPPLGETYSLSEALESALANDAEYQAALAAARAEREALPQAIADYLPQVAVVGRASASNQDVIASGTLEPGRTEVNRYSYSLEISQPILRMPAVYEIRQARVAVQQADIAEAAAKQNVMLRVATQYLQLLQALDEVELAGAERAAFDAQLDRAEQQLEQGLGSLNDLNDARSSLAIAEAREIQRGGELEDARLALQEVVGEPVAAIRGFRGDFIPSQPFPDNPEPWVRAALEQNPSLANRRLASEIARMDITRQRAARYPTLDLVASVGEQNDDQTLFSDSRQQIETAEVSLQLRMPLYAGGRNSSFIREAQARSDEADQLNEGETRGVERSTRSAFVGVMTTARLLDALRVSLEAEELRLQTRVEGLETGINSRIDVLRAYQQYFSVRRDYTSVRFDYLVNRLALQQAVGTLDERDLAELDRLLDVY